MNELYWTWGMTKDNTQWYIKVQDLDTDTYAVAYYETADDSSLRIYESRSPELLSLIILAEDTAIYTRALEQKNMLIDSKAFETATIDNFM